MIFLCTICRQRWKHFYRERSGSDVCCYCGISKSVTANEQGMAIDAPVYPKSVPPVFTGGLREFDAMTNAERDKLQRLFDMMKKRIDKSDKYFRFFAGIYLGDQSIAVQREYELIMREWKEDLKGKKNR